MWFVSLVTPYMLMNPHCGVTGTFMALMVTTFFGFLFSYFVVKETKGLTDEQCKKIYL